MMKISGTLLVVIIGMVIAVLVLALVFYGIEKVDKNIYIPIVVILSSVWMIFTVKILRKEYD